jgi:hypothetical protein
MTNKICTGQKVFLLGLGLSAEHRDLFLDTIATSEPFIQGQTLLVSELEAMLSMLSLCPAQLKGEKVVKIFVSQGGAPGDRILHPHTLPNLLELTAAFNGIDLTELFDYLAAGDPNYRLVISSKIEANLPLWSRDTPLQLAMRSANVNRLFRFDIFALEDDLPTIPTRPNFFPTAEEILSVNDEVQPIDASVFTRDPFFAASGANAPAIIVDRKVFFPAWRPALGSLAVIAFELDRPFVPNTPIVCPGADDYGIPLIYVQNHSDSPDDVGLIPCYLLELEENPAFADFDLTTFHEYWERDAFKCRVIRVTRFLPTDEHSPNMSEFLRRHYMSVLWAVELLTVEYPDLEAESPAAWASRQGVGSIGKPTVDRQASLEAKIAGILAEVKASFQATYTASRLSLDPDLYAQWWIEWGDAHKATPDRIELMLGQFFEKFMICDESDLTGLEISLTRCVPTDTEHGYGILQIYTNGRFSIYVHTQSNDSIGLVEQAEPCRHFCHDILRFFVPEPILARYFCPPEAT